MLYQLKGATVAFTNKSVRTEEVTGWKWLLNTGDGFTEVAGTENTSITFPNEAGKACTVKLLALGPWGSEVAYEEQFLTVEDATGPVIVNKAISCQSCSFIDTMLEVQSGTGMGKLTWGFVGGIQEKHGLKLEPNGRLYGNLFTDVSNTVLSVQVTDQFGRVSMGTVTFTVSGVGSFRIFSFDLDAPGTVFYDPATMKVSSLRDQFGNQIFAQTNSSRQPVFIPDDGTGKACIEFSEDLHSLVFSFSGGVYQTIRGNFFGRIKAIAPTTGSPRCIMSGGTRVATTSHFTSELTRVSPLVVRGQITLSSLPGGTAGITESGFPCDNLDSIISTHFLSDAVNSSVASVTRFNGLRNNVGTNGVFVGSYITSGSSPAPTHYIGIGNSIWANSPKISDRFRLYSFLIWRSLPVINSAAATHPNVATINALTQFFGNKYGIPCQKVLTYID